MISLDGVDAALLDQMIADGAVPNIAALRAKGAGGRVTSPIAATDDAFWASFQYAQPVGQHGRYHYLTRNPMGGLDMAFQEEAGRERFWDALSNEGRRIAVLDIPKCAETRPINGIHLADWLVHGRYFGEPQSYPEALASEVIDRFGPAPHSICDTVSTPLPDEDAQLIATNLRASVEQKRAAGLHYLNADAWDLFMLGFKEGHCAGHAFWGHTADHGEGAGGALKAVLIQIDSAVGDLVAAAGPDADVMIFSTLGMEPNGTLQHLMPQIVETLNRRLRGPWLVHTAKRVIGRLARHRFPPPLEQLPYNENCDALRLSPTARHKIDDVCALLSQLVDADTGKPVVIAIDRPSQSFEGDRSAALPDLLVRYSRSLTPLAVKAPWLGRVEAAPWPMRAGNHAPGGGLLIMTGKAARQNRTELAVEDLGPLAASLVRAA